MGGRVMLTDGCCEDNEAGPVVFDEFAHDAARVER